MLLWQSDGGSVSYCGAAPIKLVPDVVSVLASARLCPAPLTACGAVGAVGPLAVYEGHIILYDMHLCFAMLLSGTSGAGMQRLLTCPFELFVVPTL